MNKYVNLGLSTLCLLFTHCQEEILPPETSSNPAAYHRNSVRRSPYRPQRRPAPSIPEYFDLEGWLEQYAQKQTQLGCSPFLGFVRRYRGGFSYTCNTVHAVLQGKVRMRRISYYHLDLYFFVRPTSACGATSQKPLHAGAIYLSRSRRKPAYASGYYQGAAPFSYLVDTTTTPLEGWYAHYFFRDQHTSDVVGHFDGFTAKYAGCARL